MKKFPHHWIKKKNSRPIILNYNKISKKNPKKLFFLKH